MNFYELFQLLNENTISQELKKFAQKKYSKEFVDKIVSKTISIINNALPQNFNLNSKSIMAKWISYNAIKNSDESYRSIYPSVRTTYYAGFRKERLGNTRMENLILVGVQFLSTVVDYLASKVDENGNLDPQLSSQFNNPGFTSQELTILYLRYHDDLKDKQKTKPGRIGKSILDFPDGYSWVDLERGYCEVEKETMGHCGNVGAVRGDTILSLRDKKNIPHLTFILNNGILGEMKGKNNSKPSPKYHPYILKLLKLPIIKSLKGGNYLPENDFKLYDLNDEQLQELLKNKPEMEESVYIEKLKDGKEVSDDVLIKLIEKDNITFNKLIAEKTKSKQIIKMLYEKYKNSEDETSQAEEYNILMNIAANSKTEPSILNDIFIKHAKDYHPEYINQHIISALANNINVPSVLLKKILELDEKGPSDLTYFVSINPNADSDTLEYLFNKGRNNVLSHPNIPEKILRRVVNSERYGDPNFPYVQDKELRFSRIQKERLLAVAYNQNCPSDLLDKLSKEKDVHILERVIYNKNTSIETLKNLLDNDDLDTTSVPQKGLYYLRDSIKRVLKKREEP